MGIPVETSGLGGARRPIRGRFRHRLTEESGGPGAPLSSVSLWGFLSKLAASAEPGAPFEVDVAIGWRRKVGGRAPRFPPPLYGDSANLDENPHTVTEESGAPNPHLSLSVSGEINNTTSDKNSEKGAEESGAPNPHSRRPSHDETEIRPSVHGKFAVLRPIGATQNRKAKCALPYCGPLTLVFILLRWAFLAFQKMRIWLCWTSLSIWRGQKKKCYCS